MASRVSISMVFSVFLSRGFWSFFNDVQCFFFFNGFECFFNDIKGS